MRKTIISPTVERSDASESVFFGIERLARVEVTSECSGHPIESALIDGYQSGWCAAISGEQTIRLIFDKPVTLKHILLVFDELEQSCTQEFVLSWLMQGDTSFKEIVRQQFHFSPPSTTHQLEEYNVNLDQLNTLELKINPDISNGDACAKLKKLRLG